MSEQPPAPGPGFGPPPPQYAPHRAPAPPPHAPAQPGYGPVPPQPQQQAAGPEFLAVDKRNAVVVDASGVVFEMYGLSVEFRWPEIRSVHYQASPNGKALMVAVVHQDGRNLNPWPSSSERSG